MQGFKVPGNVVLLRDAASSGRELKMTLLDASSSTGLRDSAVLEAAAILTRQSADLCERSLVTISCSIQSEMRSLGTMERSDLLMERSLALLAAYVAAPDPAPPVLVPESAF